MINGLDIYYSRNVGRGLAPINKRQRANGLKPVSTKQQASGLKPVFNKRGGACKFGKRTKNITMNLIFINNI